MASLLVPTRLQIMDQNGEPLVGGEVYTYAAGTTNFKDTYTDYGKTGINTNPVILDEFGMAEIWLDGAYKIIVTYPGGDPTIPTDVISSSDNVIAYNSQDFTGLTATVADLNSTTTTAILTSVNYASTILDRGKVILVNAASAPINVILPSCVTVGNKHQIVIKKIDLSSNYVNIVTVSGQTIDGKYPFSLCDYNDYVKLQSDGSNWKIIAGRSRGTFITITASQDITLENEDNYFLCNASSGNITLSLDASSTLGNGFQVSFKKIDNSSNSITIAPDGAEQIDGLSSLILSGKNEFYTIKSNGIGWFIVTSAQSSSSVFTGVTIAYMGATAPVGWIIANDGTIGDSASGSTTRANDDTINLFVLIWNSISNTFCPIYDSTGAVSTRGATAEADFAAHKRLKLPLIKSRVIGGAGQGAGLTNWIHGQSHGEEKHTPTILETAAHPHQQYIRGAGFNADYGNQVGAAFDNLTTTDTFPSGSSIPFNVIQPSTFLNFIIKL